MTMYARWGEPADAVALPESVRQLLTSTLTLAGPRPGGARPTLPPTTLTADLMSALREACSEVDDGDPARLAHATGKSTVDLLELRAGHVPDAPDAVLRP